MSVSVTFTSITSMLQIIQLLFLSISGTCTHHVRTDNCPGLTKTCRPREIHENSRKVKKFEQKQFDSILHMSKALLSLLYLLPFLHCVRTVLQVNNQTISFIFRKIKFVYFIFFNLMSIFAANMKVIVVYVSEIERSNFIDKFNNENI